MIFNNFLKQHKVAVVLSVIVIFAFIVRVYNLHNWLYFQGDQVRNTNHAHKILEQGWAGVPLLGPKAGGTDFHLGPASYYLEFMPVLLFGLDHPAVVVYSNLFFILASILLVYLFLREAFSRRISLQITTIYASSYVTIQYARFSWNPNSLLFWGLLFILSTYKIFTVKQKNGKWILLLGLSYAIVSQLHTTALLGYPAVFLLFAIWKLWENSNVNKFKKLFTKKHKNFIPMLCQVINNNKKQLFFWLGSFFIIIMLYTPVIISEIKTGGHNTQEFIKAFQGKTASKKTIVEKLSREVTLMSKYYTLNIFSLNSKEISVFKEGAFYGIYWLGLSLLIITIIIIGKVLLYFHHFKKQSYFHNWLLQKKDFLILNFVWWFVFFILFFPLAYKLDQMRFWFINFLVPYILLAIILQWVYFNFKNRQWVGDLIVAIIILLNLSAVANWYLNLQYQNNQSYFYRKVSGSTLQQSDWVTYQDMQQAVDYMINNSSEQKICFVAPSKNRPSYRYIFEHNHTDVSGEPLRGRVELKDLEDCTVYIIKHSQKLKEDIQKNYLKYGVKIVLDKPRRFGVIIVWKVENIDLISN